MREAMPPSAFRALRALPGALIRLERGLPANSSVLRCVTPPWAPSPLSQRPRSRGCAGGRWGTKPVAGARPDPRPLPAESAAGSPPLPACGDLQAASAALPGHKHTQEGVSRQRRSRAGRAPPRRDSQLRAQPQHSPRLPASQLREPNVCREQVFCPLDSLPRGGSPCHGDAVPCCHGSCRRACRVARRVIILALCVAEGGGEERGCPCCSHAPESGDGEPRADCMAERYGA